MKMTGLYINGISVSQEYGHYLLEKENIQMRCDFGELKDCIPEFEEYFQEKKENVRLNNGKIQS